MSGSGALSTLDLKQERFIKKPCTSKANFDVADLGSASYDLVSFSFFAHINLIALTVSRE